MPDATKTKITAQWKHAGPLMACEFEPQGRYLVTSSEDYSLQRWELPSGKLTSWPAHESWIRDIAFLPDGQTMVTVASDETMIYWSMSGEKPTPLRSVQAHAGWIRTVSVSPDGKLIATGGNDKVVKLWNAADGTPAGELAGHESDVYSSMFHPDGGKLLTGELNGKMLEWDLASGKPARTFDAKELHTYNGGQGVHYGGVRSIALSPDKKLLACSGLYKASNPLGAVNEPIVVLFDMQTGKKVRSLVAEGVKGIAWQVEWLKDGSLVAASGGSGGGFLLFWRADQEKAYHKLKMPNTARDLDLHPDGLQIATAHHDRHVRISTIPG
ncbi:MAG: hypothetical protein CMJ48_13950 [Planctomycetaceae bacterium]|nr:hypothetical protein [Planctomycetaceae bacterium]